jgi:hypothetical protein
MIADSLWEVNLLSIWTQSHLPTMTTIFVQARLPGCASEGHYHAGSPSMSVHEGHRSSAHYGHKHLHPCYYILHLLRLLPPTSRSFGRFASCLQHSNSNLIEMLPAHSFVLLLDIMNCCTRLLIM